MKKSLYVFLMLFITSYLYSQTFKVIVEKFEDRTGKIAKTEGEIKASAQSGAIVGENAGAAAVSGQASGSKLESEKGDLGYQASDIFTSELVKTGKFKVIDTKLFQKKLSEMPDASAVEAAKDAGAHYLLSGNITEAGVSETGGSVLGFGGKKVQGTVRINITLTNTSTGEIVLSETSQGTESQGGITLFGSDVAAKKDLGLLISAALKDAVDSCVAKIVKVVGDLSKYPIECDLASTDNVIYLSKGSDDGISVGDEFEVIGVGKEIKIGSKVIKEKTKKGIIRVDNVFPDYATASSTIGIIISEGDKGIKIVKK